MKQTEPCVPTILPNRALWSNAWGEKVARRAGQPKSLQRTMMSETVGDIGAGHGQHLGRGVPSALGGTEASSSPGRLPSCTLVLGVWPGLRQHCRTLGKASLAADVAAWKRSGFGRDCLLSCWRAHGIACLDCSCHVLRGGPAITYGRSMDVIVT